jgi:hypothetical protein
MCLALVAPWVAVPIYFGSLTSYSTNATAVEIVLDSTDSTTDAWELERPDAWRLLGGLTAGWVRARAKRAPAPTCLSAPCAADHMCGGAHVRPSTGAAELSTCAAEHMCGRAYVRPSTCAAEHMCGRAHSRPITCAAERICGRSHVRPSAFAADHMRDLAGRRGGSGGLPPTAQDSARYRDPPPTRSCTL